MKNIPVLTKIFASHSMLDTLFSNNYCMLLPTMIKQSHVLSLFVAAKRFSIALRKYLSFYTCGNEPWLPLKPVCLGTFLSHVVNWNPVIPGRCRSRWDNGTSNSSFTEDSETRKLPVYSHNVSIRASVCRVVKTLFWRESKGYRAALSAVPVP